VPPSAKPVIIGCALAHCGMPELPDISVYVERLARRTTGQVLQRVQLLDPFVLRTALPPIAQAEGRRVVGSERLGKRVVLALDGDWFVVMHLMIAGRLRWLARTARTTARSALARFDFDDGSLLLTEAGTRHRASLHLLDGRAALRLLDAGGIDVLACTAGDFAQRLRSENHTLKRSLTNPRLFSGIGNAYSDEILHRARLSPLALTRKLDSTAIERLHAAAGATLREWTSRLRDEAGGDFPQKVTAFHPRMAVHGRFGQPCPVCGAPVQRIVYAENEANYCAKCQTGGAVLADRALSRLLHKSFPRTLED
jgi:formamidopyrimidine-DNA glycosylase